MNEKDLKYKIFVINMPSSIERYEYISSQLEKYNVPFQRMNGVNIADLSESELNKYYSFSRNQRLYPRKLTKGEIGCYIAHVKCWEEIAKQELDFAVILEDDISLNEKFPNAINFIKKQYDKWDFIRLQIETKARRLYQKEVFDDFSISEYIRNSGCFWGYALKSKTAQTLVKNILPFGITADTNMHVYYKFNVDVKTLIPPVVFQRDNNDSDIDGFGKRTKIRNFYPFARQVFNIKAYFGRFRQLARRDGTRIALSRILKSKNVRPR